MIVCYSEHSFCTDFSVLELYLADSGKNSRSSGYFMHTENLHTMRSIHTACCRNSKSSMIYHTYRALGVGTLNGIRRAVCSFSLPSGASAHFSILSCT